MIYFCKEYKMTPEKTDVTSDSSTDTFEADALKILNDMEKGWDNPDTEPKGTEKEKTPGEDPAKSEDGEWKKEEPKKEPEKEPNHEEELKIPRSRLNKEIEKRKDIQSKYDKLQEKIQQEKDKLKSLSDEEKEEQENLKKLWMDTRLSKLEDKLEDLQDEITAKDDRIKELEWNIKDKETSNLSKRLSELTEKHDWKDWLPKFDIKELLEFSKEKNFLPQDPYELYEYKYRAEIYAKKYQAKGTEIDKGNNSKHIPAKRKPTFNDWDTDFQEEAQAILDSFGATWK